LEAKFNDGRLNEYVLAQLKNLEKDLPVEIQNPDVCLSHSSEETFKAVCESLCHQFSTFKLLS
jgi:hypothetical protein